MHTDPLLEHQRARGSNHMPLAFGEVAEISRRPEPVKPHLVALAGLAILASAVGAFIAGWHFA